MRSDSKLRAELCLDFANSLRWHASDRPVETLGGYADLVAWARKAGALTEREADQLLRAARGRAAESQRVYRRGLELREAVYRIVVAHIGGRPPAPADLKRLNREIALAHRYWQLSLAGDGYHLSWPQAGAHLDRPLWHVARSAVDLLLSPEALSRVGQCADDRGCGWLFIDWSKNRSRRWCDISDCGNRAKQRRFQARSRKPRA